MPRSFAAEPRSNGCATRWPLVVAPAVLLSFLLFDVTSAAAQPPQAEQAGVKDAAPSESRLASSARFLGGALAGLGLHEAAHLTLDVVFDADPSLKRVEFHGIPFFAITHRPDVSRRRALAIDSAGFTAQHAGSEWILTRRPGLRREKAPAVKGLLAFNILTSTAYAGAAFARTGPYERDTRGIASAARIDERWVGALVLAPAVLDGLRYFHPGAKWAVWSSRGVKIGMLLLVFR
jgi:hypothetical protein